MRNKVRIMAVLTVCAITLGACGNGGASDNAKSNDAEERDNVNDERGEKPAADDHDIQDGGIGSGGADITVPNDLIDIFVQDGSHADFVYHGTDVNSIEFYIDDVYSVFIWGSSGDGYQAGISERKGDSVELCESFSYEILGNDIIVHADVSGVQGVDFDAVSGGHDLCVDRTDGDFSLYEYRWEEVAQAGEYVYESATADAGKEAGNNSGDNEEARQTSGEDADVSDLSAFAGKYVADNGDSFIIPEEPAEWYAVTEVKLDSVPGWSGTEGFYDTFVATSVSKDGDSIQIDIASQYTCGTGLLVIDGNGNAGLSYIGFSSYEISNGDYQNSTFRKQ